MSTPLQIDRIGIAAAVEHLIFKQKADIHLTDTLAIATHLNSANAEFTIHGAKGQGQGRSILPVGRHIEPEVVNPIDASDVSKREGLSVIPVQKRGRVYNGLIIDSQALSGSAAGSQAGAGGKLVTSTQAAIAG